MVILCHRLEQDVSDANANKKSEDVENYDNGMSAGATKEHHEYSKTVRSANAVDESRTLALCGQLEGAVNESGKTTTETQIYREKSSGPEER
jgi:hypothetical protein